MTAIPNKVWDALENSLTSDNHPGANFLREHLGEIKDIITNNPNGSLVAVEHSNEPGRLIALAGISIRCFTVHLHFMYVCPAQRDTQVFLDLMKAVTQAGRNERYAFVVVYCPDIIGCESIGDAFIEISINEAEYKMTSGVKVLAYAIPKKEWEKFFK